MEIKAKAETTSNGYVYVGLDIIDKEKDVNTHVEMTFKSEDGWDVLRSRLMGGSLSEVKLTIEEREVEG